jgi:phosphonate transport system permease protein
LTRLTSIHGINVRIGWLLVFLVLIVWSGFSVEWSNLVNRDGGSALKSIGIALLSPDLSPANLKTVTSAAWTTVSYATAALSLAILFGLPLGLIASGTLLPNHKLGMALSVVTRAFLGLTRSIHELVWALLLVIALGLSPASGIIAIAVPYSGIIGRIFAERLQDVPGQQITSLRSSGASGVQLVALGHIPSALPDTISYLFYRFECAIRTASVLSFVGLGGIGYQVHIALSDLKFETVATLLYSLLILILLVDVTSNSIRKRLLA